MKSNQIVTLFVIAGSCLTIALTYASGDFDLSGYDPGQRTYSTQQTVPNQQTTLQYANSLFHHAGDPIAGNPNGSITLVEFFDYRCIHSINMDPVINQLIRNNPNLRVVYKEFPRLGGNSWFAAKAALAAKNQGKYIPYHEALLSDGSDLSENKVLALANHLGLDVGKLTNDMKNDSVLEPIQDNQRLAKQLGLSGTPLFFIGKTQSSKSVDCVIGEVDQSKLQQEIDKY